MKTTEIYINGELADREALKKRKDATLKSTHVITKKFYTAPLNTAEKAKQQKDAENASKFFAKMHQQREELEQRHG